MGLRGLKPTATISSRYAAKTRKSGTRNQVLRCDLCVLYTLRTRVDFDLVVAIVFLVGNDLAVPLSLANDELGIPIFGAES